MIAARPAPAPLAPAKSRGWLANAGWINYMLKDRQKSEFDGFVDCITIESLHNPIADA